MKQNRKKSASKKESFFTKLINKIKDELINTISKFIVLVIKVIFFILILKLCPNTVIKLFVTILDYYYNH